VHVDKNTIVGGLSAKEARDFFRSIGTNNFCESSLDQKLLAPMLYEGLIEDDPSNRSRLRLTNLAVQISHANFLKRMSRDQADKLMEDVLNRACSVNDEFRDNPYRLKHLVVFGSYLRDQPTLGDIDLSPVLDLRDENDSDHLVDACQDYAYRHAPNYLSFFNKILYPQTVITRFLKARSPRLDFCPMDNVISLGAPYKIVWSADGGLGDHDKLAKITGSGRLPQ